MEPRSEKRSLRIDAALLVSVGIVLGLAYNALGLRPGNGWGLAWIGVDQVQQLTEAPMVEPVAADAAPMYVSDDPLAAPSTANAAVPEIMDIARPVQIELEAVRQLFEADAALFIDARDPEEHAQGHIPGAINLPYDEAITDPARLEALETGGRPIVAYCGGGTCEVSLSLAWELLAAGHTRIAVYMGGFPEWERAGLPVAVAEEPE